MDRFAKKIGRLVERKPWWIIGVTLLVVCVAAMGMGRLSINNDTRVFFSEQNPQLKALEALENTYDKTNNVLFAVAPEDGNVFTPRTLSAVAALTEASWRMPYSSRVHSITNFQHTRAQGDDLIVEDLVRDPGALSSGELSRIKMIAHSEPLLQDRLISPAGHVTGVNVVVIPPGESLDEIPEMAAFARRLARKFRRDWPGIRIHLTGGVMMDNAFGEAGIRDMTTLVPLMLLTLTIIVGLALRSFAATLVTLLIILFSTITAMGLAGWLGIMITAASSGAPTIILTLAVADSVHLLATAIRHLRKGASKPEAVAESIRVNLQPVFITSLTTAIGFLTMNFSDAPPFRDLGNIVAMGVLAALVYSIFFLPAALTVIPLGAPGRASGSRQGKRGGSPWDRLADFVIARQKMLLRGTWLLIAIMAAGTLRIDLNDDWVKYFDESYEIRRATDFVEENLTGFHLIEYSLKSGETGGINDPRYLRTVDRFAAWYRKQPKVVHVHTISDTMKRLNMNMHGDDRTHYRLPEARELAAQYLLLYEMSLPFGFDLNSLIDVDRSATRMLVNLKGTTTRELRETDEKARAWLKENAPEEMFTYGSGLSVIFAHLSRRNINSMLGASFGALVLISLIMIIALGSFRLGLLSLVPNLSPAFMAFGVWGLTVGQVGLGLSVVAAMTLGIVVDDTVHLADIVNQTDGVESIDGEDKLGQPMVHLSFPGSFGVFEMFLMPFFRERTFPGQKGRLRPGTLVETNHARYESSAQERHMDFAVRYSHTIGTWDFGIYHFKGTGREPTLIPAPGEGGSPVLIPYYEQIDQTGLDLQKVAGRWLWKLEGIHRTGQGEGFVSAIGGFEYTFVSIGETSMDLGVLCEWAYDDRGSGATTFFQNDIMFGLRLTLNDAESSTLLAGVSRDLDGKGSALSIEASRRFGDRWLLSMEARAFFDLFEDDPLGDLVDDDSIRLELARYF